MKRSASAHWSGDTRDGTGGISTGSGVLRDAPYGFKSRFEDGHGTNPEELIGAAHAACFSMALALGLSHVGRSADSIDTRAEVSMDKDGDGFSITAVHLTCRARVPDADAALFDRIAQQIRSSCPVSKVLNAAITLDARLEE